MGFWYRWLSPEKRLEWYPPLRALRIRVLEHGDGGRKVRILLPLNRRVSNPGGGMFGGAMAALADPIAALALNRVFPGHSLWTRSMTIDFRREGRADLELRFELDPQHERAITAELAQRGRASPTLEYGFYLPNGRVAAWVHNKVAIRPLDYRPSASSGDNESE